MTWLVGLLQKYNDPKRADFRLRFVYDVAQPEGDQKLMAAKAVTADMGVKLKADEVRELGGFSKPQPGDELTEPPKKPLPGEGGSGKNGSSGANGST